MPDAPDRPDPSTHTQLVRDALADVYLPAGINLWLAAPNHQFGMATPASEIAAGRGEAVVAYARRIGGGAW